MPLNKNVRTLLYVILVPVAYALLMRFLFDLKGAQSLFKIMSLTFLLLLPFGVGAITVYFSTEDKVRKVAYCIFFPWIPIFVFFFLTLALSIEGWACWLMILPLFLIAATLAGLMTRYFKLRKRNEKVYVSLVVLLPLFISPIERLIGDIPGTYEAYTSIDIAAPKEKIWSNVTRVKTIERAQDKGWLTDFLGFPRPIRAELNYEGVGATRSAIFDKGLTFHETVLEYSDKQKMVFSIKAYPYEIPSTTMDKHVVVGGAFFDVLNGTYELQQLNATTYRLNLYSHFKLNTTFNFYASWWAGLIMKDIQNNILQVINKEARLAKAYFFSAFSTSAASLSAHIAYSLPDGCRPSAAR